MFLLFLRKFICFTFLLHNFRITSIHPFITLFNLLFRLFYFVSLAGRIRHNKSLSS
ncbi:hypothetical protein GLOIN_2v1724492 [Rhizophagus irregularis DAOM 181602=DAOM 197198]|uniref:Uncharacterized protein n=1 Tax=Rhizophagus irregularis (strain DAOM 181602 / DAOM 197198 / MUCL 43194) TaxID=747089 RepID=A0A2P4P195_RHIID|nr:hypothetical protein GLOIN_2v1724492 [Rhizophagus irregularis DAOM 181602=DAOM 197198]POG59160.1 hypothetical protein GLOIN_2v1724492 [Rhizophagus irregularis DAOM 181602=DAOM 197198]|eukprot:XP_025166026.1 hypothetical protein GLOIN_2v1724492 [Rhizophagus irregularis DAOM 181602=DAOM 197198]